MFKKARVGWKREVEGVRKRDEQEGRSRELGRERRKRYWKTEEDRGREEEDDEIEKQEMAKGG